MDEQIREITELLEQMYYDGTNETAPEICEELESKYKELTGEDFYPKNVYDTLDSIDNHINEIQEKLKLYSK
ncbi:MAG: hypothetical protein KJ906_01775 [Nanoarchaeota archaeon]|nr:hypothetical protein [Nanoarchaeota archaeon]